MKTVSLYSAAITLLVFLSPPATGDDDLIGDGVFSLPLFDAHIHYKEPAWGRFRLRRF